MEQYTKKSKAGLFAGGRAVRVQPPQDMLKKLGIKNRSVIIWKYINDHLEAWNETNKKETN